MPTYGVTPAGFVRKPMAQILADIEAKYRGAAGNGINAASRSRFGQLIGIHAGVADELWDLAAAVYASRNPGSAVGTGLDDTASITGTRRLAAAASTVDAVAVGTNGTLLVAGRAASVAGTDHGVKFQSVADRTIVTAPSWATGQAYAFEALVKNGGEFYYQLNPAGGVSAAMGGGPAGHGVAIVDNTCLWYWCGTATAGVVVPMEGSVTGSLAAPAGTLTGIETPVGGWASVVNPLAAALGRGVEPDPALRVRREVELRAIGLSASDAVRAYLLQNVAGVVSVAVLSNEGDVVDGNGLLPHSMEAVVLGGDDQAVANGIWHAKPLGCATNGTTTKTVVDASGGNQTVKFTRPTLVPIYFALTLHVDAATFPSNGDALVEAAVAAYGTARFINPGASVIDTQFFAPIFGACPGVVDVVHLYMGLAANPVTTGNQAMTVLQLPTFDSANVAVAHA